MAGDSLLRLPLAGDYPWPTADACWAVAAAPEEEGAGQAGSRLRLALALGGYRLGSGVRDHGLLGQAGRCLATGSRGRTAWNSGGGAGE